MVCENNFCIRQAKKKDFPEILRLYKAGLDEIGEKWVEEKLLDKIDRAFYCAPCFLLVIGDKICGMAGLTASFICCNGKITLSDYMVYVEPQHRSLKLLSGLVEECKDFARRNKYPLRLDFISQKDEQLRIRLLRMHGFKIHSIVGVYND